tara:strand:- start:714 stop:998 length:285 start_codon:yes stop_codon:yes gene_type:complete
MQLLTKAIIQKFQKTGTQDVENPIVIAKFFNPVGIGTWLATEFDPITKVFFGRVDLQEREWGFFSLEELENVKLRFGLGIERDIHFEPTPINEV